VSESTIARPGPRGGDRGPHRFVGRVGGRSGYHGHRAGAGLAAGAHRAGLGVQELDLVEINEVFAAQYLAVERELGVEALDD
jgi:hypothetical protein